MSYALSSNLITLIISTLVILVVPKLIGVEQYGYWQLYLFYTSYVGLLHLGWNDGIYLRFGGEEYDNLNKRSFSSQFCLMLVFQLLLGLLIWGFSSYFTINIERNFIIKMTAVILVIVNLRLMLLYILQATNRIKEYAVSTIIDRLIYIILIGLLLMNKIYDYRALVFADLIGKLASLLYAIYTCKEVVFNKFISISSSLKEVYLNLTVGSKLMFANIASMLIIGIVRFGIERTWDVATFGRISLILSICNMMLIFINAIGIIIFPILRRGDQGKLKIIYENLRNLLMPLVLGLLIFFYPAKEMLSRWLPQYEESLLYMALLFPMFVFEGKTSLLINTYLKTLRKEKVMLNINTFTMLLSLVTTLVSTQLFKNLNVTIFSIVLLLGFRSVLAEIYLSQELKIDIRKDILLELMMIFVFIVTGWYIDSWVSTLTYLVSYLLYLVIKKNDLKNTAIQLRILIQP